MQLVILRHGRTQANEDHLYVGAHLDLPLSKNGRIDARNCGCNADISTVYVSPMLRARETARICFPQARQIPVEDFREMDFGVFEGRSADSMANDTAYRSWIDNWCIGKCPGGEDVASFTTRVSARVKELLCQAAQEGAERLVIAGHSGTVLAIMNTFTQGPNTEGVVDGKAYFEWLVSNAEGYFADVHFDDDGNPHLIDPIHFTNLDFLNR